jgi:GTP-binding protein Era
MRTGIVSIIGRPNAGKSTLLNHLVGEKVAIVTSKPQTTRTRIRGVLEVAAEKGRHPAAQIVLVDTPGVHVGSSQLDRRMMHEVRSALDQRDLVLWVVDATREVRVPDPAEDSEAKPAGKAHTKASEDAAVLALVRDLDCPVFLVLNKIDLIEREKLLPLITRLTALQAFAEVVPISARKKDGLDRLVTAIVQRLPEGPRLFPKDQFTDQPERFLAAELIRERILMETGEEVPYASAVVIEEWEELDGGARSPGKRPLTRIAAAIYCERPGQKAILIGKGGSKLREIGASARREIEALLGTRVYLALHVIVEENWRQSRGFVDSLDWRQQLENLAQSQARKQEPEKQ